ncbi:hypothetical protein L4X63_01450 [Geomonas sp. Red32]|uniref:hypothetical protein n=1 Tax=Geomonas sp. Red32 TaxID=2912856 RepID=UPI00202CAA87|nr:hypothetical protein [Geomonas sp. Red32]MCM0080245.1 hypothetical protein [Geomonas sp. Red32]
MRRLLLVIAVLAVSAVSCFADGGYGMGGGGYGAGGGGGPMVMGGKSDPQMMLMMAYHKEIMIFGRTLQRMAGQREMVPAGIVRTVVGEMRRGAEQMEKYRAGAMAAMPPEMRTPDRQKMMDQHLVDVKTHLRQLDELAAKGDVPSGEVNRHLDAIFHGCDEMGCGMAGRGMHGKGMHGCMTDGRCGCMHEQRCGSQWGGHDMMPEHRKMMQEMTQKLEAQDADLMKRVEEMKRAPRDAKVDMLGEIVDRMVHQRAEMTRQMEKMQKAHMEHHHGDGGAMEHGCGPGSDMEMGDMNMEGADE